LVFDQRHLNLPRHRREISQTPKYFACLAPSTHLPQHCNCDCSCRKFFISKPISIQLVFCKHCRRIIIARLQHKKRGCNRQPLFYVSFLGIIYPLLSAGSLPYPCLAGTGQYKSPDDMNFPIE